GDEEARLLVRASHGCGLGAAAIVIFAIALVHAGATAAAPGGGPSRIAVALATICVCFPFILFGAISAAALRALSPDIEAACFALCGGAAAAALASVLVLRAGGGRSLLAVAGMLAAACLTFALGAWRGIDEPSGMGSRAARPRPAVVATCLLAT